MERLLREKRYNNCEGAEENHRPLSPPPAFAVHNKAANNRSEDIISKRSPRESEVAQLTRGQVPGKELE